MFSKVLLLLYHYKLSKFYWAKVPMESGNEYIIAWSTVEKEDPKIASIFTWSDSINIQFLLLQPHAILFMPLLMHVLYVFWKTNSSVLNCSKWGTFAIKEDIGLLIWNELLYISCTVLLLEPWKPFKFP